VETRGIQSSHGGRRAGEGAPLGGGGRNPVLRWIRPPPPMAPVRTASPCRFSLFGRLPVGFIGGFGSWRRRFRQRSCGRSFPGSSRSAPRSFRRTPDTATTPATSASGSSWSASRPTRLLTATSHHHPMSLLAFHLHHISLGKEGSGSMLKLILDRRGLVGSRFYFNLS
jgi:hypothetical protein